MSKSTQANLEMDAQAEFDALRQRAAALGVIPQQIAMAPDGRVRMAVLDYARFAGDLPPAGYISLGLCTRSIAPISRQSRQGTLSGVLRPGSVILSPPDEGATVRWDRCRMIAIGIDPEGLDERLNLADSRRLLSSAALRIHRDPLLTAIMTALWHESAVNGLSGDFFDHCIGRVFSRLGELAGDPPTRRRDRPLTAAQVIKVKEFIATHLEEGAGVAAMAALVGRDPASFSRAFRDATGLPPHQFLTNARMAQAEALLRDGMSVTATATAVGYTNPSKFSAAYQRYRGTKPSRCRQT
ncbi:MULTISPECIES: helix-turn-helix domain-containing protein [unclassified Azospirillum]|uniref:helix-turn-helix domain-containing protein n=1 Tax=unclassified Azospirillum TaxID=2630922 RepID=UPI000B6EDF99|nr:MULTISPECIES: AraC family transcriptional regulator [unclassified Azospirillum]SNS91269.1 AraC family transcriptional regulator [Azospirillum sp. RU38E]SNT08325.1 AraC family transcriptional regulator [Azospirillum sp. RU37A]